MENIKIYAGKVLRKIREYRGLSCPGIAARFGISATAIYDYEQGRSYPKAGNAGKLASALRIDWDTFQSLISSQVGNDKVQPDPAQLARHIISAGVNTKINQFDPLLQVVILNWKNLSSEAKGKIITILEEEKVRTQQES